MPYFAIISLNTYSEKLTNTLLTVYTGPRPTAPLITPKQTGQILNEDDPQQ